MTMSNGAERLKRLQRKVASAGLDCLLLGARDAFDANTFYYSGDATPPKALLMTADEAFCFSHPKQECPGFENVEMRHFKKQLTEFAKKHRVKKLGVDMHSDMAFAAFYIEKAKHVSFVKQLLSLREIKDADEQNALRFAQDVTKQCVAEALDEGIYGRTENEVAGVLEYKARSRGFSLSAFEPIVLANERAAVPHGKPTQYKIKRGDAVIIDVGVRAMGYCGDYSTTVYDGGNNELRHAISAVREAKAAATKKARIGALGSDLRDSALHILYEHGFKDVSFSAAGLSLGHQIGLDVHEGATRLEKTRLRKGMAFTIEPGVYVNGKYGVRFEDVVLL
ncbi:Xaa-Pro dipeptidase [Candidatus Norongarragalina meridionalis]|nr:Xaa-Pro dipeptidase [Candidatus Norongarragalina meridionalis]